MAGSLVYAKLSEFMELCCFLLDFTVAIQNVWNTEQESKPAKYRERERERRVRQDDQWAVILN